jgi:hypothetical protein
MPDALRDDTSFSGACSRNNKQRPFAVRNRAPLRIIQL